LSIDSRSIPINPGKAAKFRSRSDTGGFSGDTFRGRHRDNDDIDQWEPIEDDLNNDAHLGRRSIDTGGGVQIDLNPKRLGGSDA